AEPGSASRWTMGMLEGAAKLAAVVAERALEPPTGAAKIGRNTTGEPRCLRRGGLFPAGDELGPGVRGADVDRAQLPDAAAVHVVQPADKEAVEAAQLARPLRLHVLLR